jgi:streptogramin lyase
MFKKVTWVVKLFGLVLVSLVALVGCTPPRATEYALTIGITPDGSGSVARNPDRATYADGVEVQLTATAESGWVFDHWEGSLSGNSNPSTLLIDSDKQVTAVFVAARELTSFGFVSPAVTGTIDEGGHTVAATVPWGTYLTGLVAVFTTTGSQVLVGSTVQVSGMTANDLTNPVTYTVAAEDGSTQDYTVTVTVAVARTIAGIVTTLAGSAGVPGDADGTGLEARFNGPMGIAVQAGYLYIADTDNHTIRRLDPATGAVTTLAGSAGNSGSDDGTGSAARFNQPAGIASDGSYLYVADTYYNHTIRRLDPATGAVTTLAGSAGNSGSDDGTGSAARFFLPAGMAFGGSHLYVSDAGNSTIRRVDPGTREVTTVAGSAGIPGSDDGTGTAARFSNPFGIAVDGSFLYVADLENHTIRRLDPGTGEVTTVAGSAGAYGSDDGTGTAARFNGPSGIVFDGIYLYVVNHYGHTIRSVSPALGVVTTLAGSAGIPGSDNGTGSAARFRWPVGIAADGNYLYVVDGGTSTIRRIE